MSGMSTSYKFNRKFITSMVCMVHACIHTIPNAKVDMHHTYHSKCQSWYEAPNMWCRLRKLIKDSCSVRLAWYVVIDSLSEHCRKKSNKQLILLLSYCRKWLFWRVNWDLFSEHLPDLLQIVNVIMLTLYLCNQVATNYTYTDERSLVNIMENVWPVQTQLSGYRLIWAERANYLFHECRWG